MNYHCFTMRKCCAPKTLKQVERTMNDYEYYLKQLKKADEKLHIEYHYECVSTDNGRYNVHLHAMLKTPRENISFRQKKGYSIRIEACRSKIAWTTYITKSNMTKQMILNHIYHQENPSPISYDSESSLDGLIEDAPNYDALYKKKLFS